MRRLHRENLSNLQKNNDLNVGFDNESVNALGPISSKQHHNTVAAIKNGTHSSGPSGKGIAGAMGPTPYYQINDSSLHSEIEDNTKSTIKRIYIENAISWVIILVFLLVIIGILLLFANIAISLTELTDKVINGVVNSSLYFKF